MVGDVLPSGGDDAGYSGPVPSPSRAAGESVFSGGAGTAEGWLSVADAARFLSVSPARVRQVAQSGAVVAVHDAQGVWRIDPVSLEQYRDQRRPGRPRSSAGSDEQSVARLRERAAAADGLEFALAQARAELALLSSQVTVLTAQRDELQRLVDASRRFIETVLAQSSQTR